MERGPGSVTILTPSGSPWPFGNSGTWTACDSNFAAFCEKLLADGVPDPMQAPGRRHSFNSIFYDRATCADHVVTAARLACWAESLGQRGLARRLLDHARKAREQYGGYLGHGDPKRDAVLATVADTIAMRLRVAAVIAAHRGTPRPELLRQWQRIARIPHHEHIDEARRMASHYESLVAEDLAWKEPDPAALATMTVAQKAHYWLYHLRDHGLGASWLGGGSRSGRPDPTIEL